MRASILALGGLVGLGTYLVATDAPQAPAIATPAPVAAAPVARALIPSTPPRLPALPPELDLSALAGDEEVDEELVELHGLELPADPSEFAMVFAIGDDVYLRLADDEPVVTGRPRMIEDDGSVAVIASVATKALPQELRRWSNERVLVDGDCESRVVGFAQVSRAAGESGPSEYDEESETWTEPPGWTVEAVQADSSMLVAKLDGQCRGTWARSTTHARAQVAFSSPDAELEQAATADLLADDAARQTEWTEQGGEGRWQDAVEVTAQTFEHPGTGEQWVFVQAARAGGCGDPSMSAMAAYKVTTDGSVQRVADLDYAFESIQQMVDIDDDGEPELVVGSGDRVELVDLTNQTRADIDVPYHSYGCGC